MSKYIVIEGLIGVERPRFVASCATRWSARLVLEPAEDNRCGRSRGSRAFCISCSDVLPGHPLAQQADLRQGGLLRTWVVADYHLRRTRSLRADPQGPRNGSLRSLHFAFGAQCAQARLWIFLDSPTEVIQSALLVAPLTRSRSSSRSTSTLCATAIIGFGRATMTLRCMFWTPLNSVCRQSL